MVQMVQKINVGHMMMKMERVMTFMIMVTVVVVMMMMMMMTVNNKRTSTDGTFFYVYEVNTRSKSSTSCAGRPPPGFQIGSLSVKVKYVLLSSISVLLIAISIK